MKNVLELTDGSLTEDEFKAIYKNADKTEFIRNKENEIKRQFGIKGLLIVPKRNENLP